MLKVWWFEIKPLTLHTETKTQCQGNKKVEKMKTIDLELSNKILKCNVEAMEAKVNELNSQIEDLKHYNDRLLSLKVELKKIICLLSKKLVEK